MTKQVMKILGASNHTTDEREINDYYATDPNALVDFLRAFNNDGETLSEKIWECSCGEGNLSKEFLKRGHDVRSTDLIDRGFGTELDFLTVSPDEQWNGDIVTNPPYKLSEQFVKRSLDVVPEGRRVVMLFKMQFVESQRRAKLFKTHPIKYIYVHSKRIGIWKNNEPTSNQALCYAWFIWEKGFQGDTVIRWI